MQPVQRELANLLVMAEDQAAPQTLGHLYTPEAHPETVRPVIKLPPSSFALQLLRSLRGKPTFLTRQHSLKLTSYVEKESVFFLFYGFHDRAQIETLCQRVYFPIESLSASEATLFNGILYSILREGSFIQSFELREEELSNMRVLCEANFQAGLERFEVLAIPTHENAMILSLAVMPPPYLRNSKHN